MRKLILKWLFGTDNIDRYFKLLAKNDEYFDTYIKELREHRDDIIQYRNKVLDHMDTLNDMKKLIKICENRGIDVDKEIKEVELQEE